MRKVTEVRQTVMMPPQRKRVAAYARVSSGKDAMLNSLSAQISYYNEYIQNHNDWDLGGIYADEAMTGTKDNRPEFQRLLADCREGKIDMIVTKSVTRFARNTVTLLETVRELRELGIAVFFEKENCYAHSVDGEFVLTLMASYAQQESWSASENMKWRIRKMFEQGRPNTGNMLGYRLFHGTLYVIPEEAEIVKMIFADYLSGMGRNAIMRKLNNMGIPASGGGKWGESTLHRILRNEKYAGDMLLQKTYRLDHISKKTIINRGERPMYHVEDSHEAIIDKETFAAVQREIERRAKKCKPQTRKHYPFTSLLRCGQCGKCYRRRIAAAGSKYEKPVWMCATFNAHGKSACSSQQIPENILIAKTIEILGVAKLTEEVLKQQIFEIQMPQHSQLVYVFKDGHVAVAEWQNPSRRESWTEEMKQVARDRQQAIVKKRGDLNE
jgi:DNA invertase Pin-like site-specific DNA recombinase